MGLCLYIPQAFFNSLNFQNSNFQAFNKFQVKLKSLLHVAPQEPPDIEWQFNPVDIPDQEIFTVEAAELKGSFLSCFEK